MSGSRGQNRAPVHTTVCPYTSPSTLAGTRNSWRPTNWTSLLDELSTTILEHKSHGPIRMKSSASHPYFSLLFNLNILPAWKLHQHKHCKGDEQVEQGEFVHLLSHSGLPTLHKELYVTSLHIVRHRVQNNTNHWWPDNPRARVSKCTFNSCHTQSSKGKGWIDTMYAWAK